MEAITKVKAIDILTTYGHVYLGAGNTPLGELAERIDQHAASGEADRLAMFAELRHATRVSGQTVYFPSLNPDYKQDSRLDLAGKSTTAHVYGQYLVILDQYPAENPDVPDRVNSTAYFIPGLDRSPAHC